MAVNINLSTADKVRFDSTSTGDGNLLTLNGLSSGAGRISDIHDWGVAPRPDEYLCLFQYLTTAAPSAKAPAKVYIAEGLDDDSGTLSGNLSTVDAAISAEDNLRSLKHVATIQTNSSGSEYQRGAFKFRSAARYIQVAVWNGVDGTFVGNNTDSYIDIQPIYDDDV